MEALKASLLRYLDARQHLWNSNFLSLVGDIHDCAPFDDFDVISNRLFAAIVCHPHKIAVPENFVLGGDAISAIDVSARRGLSGFEVMFSRSVAENNRYWELPKLVTSSDLQLEFIDFFQWDSYGFLSMSKVRCLVKRFSPDSSFAGRQAIVELNDVEFFLNR